MIKIKFSSAYRSVLRGYRDWRILLLVFCFLILVIFGAAYYSLWRISASETITSTARDLITLPEREAIEETITLMKERAERYETLRGAARSTIDLMR